MTGSTTYRRIGPASACSSTATPTGTTWWSTPATCSVCSTTTIAFFRHAAEGYERRTGGTVEPAPVLAWHIRTVVGDALWRSEAGVPLPGGGTVDEWVEELRERIAALAAWRPFDAPR